MTSQPRRPERGAAPAELVSAVSRRFESTSRRLLGGIRHLQREVTQRQQQLGQALDRFRRDAESRIQGCLSRVQRPASTNVAFAAMSGQFGAQRLYDVALRQKEVRKHLDPVLVVAVQDGKRKSAGFVFMGTTEAQEMLRKLKETNPDLAVGAMARVMPLGEFYEKFMARRRSLRRKMAFHFVPETDEVYYATEVKKREAIRERERELVAELEAELEDMDEVEEGEEALQSGDGKPDATETEDDSGDGTHSESDSESENLLEEEPVTVTGVPVFVCRGMIMNMGSERKLPHFLSYKDLDCYMRLAVARAYKKLDKQFECLATVQKDLAASLRQKALSAEGEEAQKLMEKAEEVEEDHELSVETRLSLGCEIVEQLQVDVVSLESVIETIEKEKTCPLKQTLLVPPGWISTQYEKAALLNYLRKKKLSSAPKRSPIVPLYLLD